MHFTVFDPPEDDAIIADSQAVTTLPLPLHWFDVSAAGCAEPGDRRQNAQGRSPVDRAESPPEPPP